MIQIANKKLRKLLQLGIPFVLIPLLVYLGAMVFESRRHIYISLCVAFCSLLLFVAGYEKKSTGTRRMVITAVITALCVAGRMIPLLKPVTALTILGAIYLGKEAGFLIGSLSALLSNIYFGQGPWTAFQMLAWGLIGYFASVFSHTLKRKKLFLYLYGIGSGILFSFIMDVWTVLWASGDFEMQRYLYALTTAVPYTIVYAVSNLIYLILLEKPLGDKLKRIQKKYGI